MSAPFADYHPERQAFDALFQDNCEKRILMFCGESGIGKSFWLEAAWPEIEAEITAHGERTLRINLGEYGNEVLLVEDLFGPSGLGGWDPTSQRLHLYLDSLDECQMRC